VAYNLLNVQIFEIITKSKMLCVYFICCVSKATELSKALIFYGASSSYERNQSNVFLATVYSVVQKVRPVHIFALISERP